MSQSKLNKSNFSVPQISCDKPVVEKEKVFTLSYHKALINTYNKSRTDLRNQQTTLDKHIVRY